MEDERFYWLISRTNAGDIKDHEFNELLSLIAEKPELRSVYELLTTKPETGSPSEYEEAMKAYTVHYAKMQLSGHLEHIPSDQSTLGIRESKGKGIFKMWILKTIAASLLLGVLVFLFISKQSENTQLVFISKKGTKNKMTLPDGTKVWLNADSKLTLAKQFTGPTREVRLSGEAYFEVAHDKNHPFIISANAIKVKVLGTVFNLKAYPDDEDTETTLIQGQVEVSIDGQSSSRISLKP
jgi:transmembrane sensor